MSELHEALDAHGSKAAAARALGIPVSTFKDRLRKAPKGDDKREATLTSTVPVTVSEAAEELGIDLATWNITDLTYGKDAKDKRSIKLTAKPKVSAPIQKALESSVRALEMPARPKVRPLTPRPVKRFLEVGITDLHMGKRAWAEECGEDFDLDISRDVYANAVEDTLSLVNPYLCDVAEIVLIAGSDFFQCDNANSTTVAGTVVDSVDTRYSRVFEVGFRAVADSIERLSEVAPVRVVWLPANHDEHISWTLAFCLKQYFAKFNPNGVIDDSPKVRKYLKYGKVLLGLTHGHNVRLNQLGQIMSIEAREFWSECTTKEFHAGHLHRRGQIQTIQTEENLGVTLRVLPALSATDKWHAENGYVGSKRGVQSMLYDFEDGYLAQFDVGVRK